MPPPSIGTGPSGGILWIGESVSDSQIIKNYMGQLPFSHGPASDFLFRAMDVSGIPWHIGYYTNADDINLQQVLSGVKPQLVVTLGAKAKNLVRTVKQQWPWIELNHPQYVKRFGGIDAISDYVYEMGGVMDAWQDFGDITKVWGNHATT